MLLLPTLVTCIVIQAMTVYAANCPNGWLPHDTSCYFFSKDREPWPMAAAHCNALGAELPVIETEREDTFLRNTLLAMHGESHSSIYFSVGGTDIATETEWVWAKTQTPMSYTGWAPHEPDSIGDQDCLILGSPQGFKWNDGKCTDLFNFICEKKSQEIEISHPGDIIGK